MLNWLCVVKCFLKPTTWSLLLMTARYLPIHFIIALAHPAYIRTAKSKLVPTPSRWQLTSFGERARKLRWSLAMSWNVAARWKFSMGLMSLYSSCNTNIGRF
mgnify:CR=1 FL=1